MYNYSRDALPDGIKSNQNCPYYLKPSFSTRFDNKFKLNFLTLGLPEQYEVNNHHQTSFRSGFKPVIT